MNITKAAVFLHEQFVGNLWHDEATAKYHFDYLEGYQGKPISLTMPISKSSFTYNTFPPFFDGLLPEGWQLAGLLRARKLDANDFMGQLICVGQDLVGAVTVLPSKPEIL